MKTAPYSDIYFSIPTFDDDSNTWYQETVWFHGTTKRQRYTICDNSGNHEHIGKREVDALAGDVVSLWLAYSAWVVEHLPPDDVTVSWEPERRVQAFVDSLDAALTEADEMKSDGFPEPAWGPEARAAFDGAQVNPSPVFSPELIKLTSRIAALEHALTNLLSEEGPIIAPHGRENPHTIEAQNVLDS